MQDEIQVRQAEDVETPTVAQREEAATKAAEKEPTPLHPGVTKEEGHHTINLDKIRDNAIQERETKTVDVGEQTGDGQKVDQGVRVEPAQEDTGTETQSGSDESPIEFIEEPATDGDSTPAQGSVDQEPDNTPSEEGGSEPEPVHEPVELPEGIDKLVNFMKETGGSLEDYLYLNRDVDKMDGTSLLREHYKQKFPDLNDGEISFMLNEEFLYDQEADSEREIKKKQIAYKKAVGEAKSQIKQMRDKFYQDLKFSRGNDLTDNQKDAIKAYEKQQELDKLNTLVREDYVKKTNSYFNDFKGFEFKLNDKKVRYKLADPNKTKEYQQDPNTWINSYTDDKGYLKDPASWHKAMYAAQNIDKIAQHFYDQGRADAVKQSAAKAKNIDMDPRQSHGEVKVDGQRIRVVSGDDSDKLRFRIGKYR